jgi:uncharacterized membrane protein YcaP (DUF421 family)
MTGLLPMPFEHTFFLGWAGVIRTILSGALAYFILILMLRVSGKRTLAKMNAFDFVVTVALGSILATITMSKDVALAEGAAALGVLIGLQFLVAWLSARLKTVSDLVKAEPALLFHRGEFLHAAMRRERVAEDEVRAAIRNAGHAAFEKIEAVVLETDGSFSVIAMPDDPQSSPGDSALSKLRAA